MATRTVSDASKDSASWEKVKYSNRISDFQRYLEEHPSGMFVKLAESQMRALIEREADPEAVKSQFAGIDFGAYHALIIGIDDYENLPKLKTAVRDAKAIAAMLENNYGFKVNMLIDPERADIIDALDEYRETLGPTDNLLIYYAGHGWLDEESGEGYWLTRSAKSNRRSRWISNATITNTLKVLSAKHVMVVADSCYSGTLTRAAAVGFRDKEYYRRMASKQARVAMVSGGLEPVADDTGKGNSPFATALLDALRKNPDVIDGTRLFSEIRRPVILNAQQTPEYSDVRNAGHEGGDFLFVRTK
ncbi:MAG: caspase family protein [Proteobacteria bacterium]|nr:caspase family protein [Pseudomonadota bacterium]